MAKPRGLYVIQAPAQCSIFESGRMMYECIRRSTSFDLDYFEATAENQELDKTYDFYIFNFHHATMSWLNLENVKKLPGLKMTFVLEVLDGNPFVYCPRGVFDVYLPVDPTFVSSDPSVIGISRPLEDFQSVTSFDKQEIPVIGSFGFGTPGKGFEFVVDAVNKEFDRAKVRINIPFGTFTKVHGEDLPYRLAKLCKGMAKPGIDVEVTHDFMSSKELISWCEQNTLNCFLYNRYIPGLSATTDQAIVAGRPLAVSIDPTFRHVHKYLKPFPKRSLRQSIELSLPEVLKMREDWSSAKFLKTFEGILLSRGLITSEEA